MATLQQMKADGWKFSHNHGFITAQHPNGGAFCVCQMTRNTLRGEEFTESVVEAFLAVLNCKHVVLDEVHEYPPPKTKNSGLKINPVIPDVCNRFSCSGKIVKKDQRWTCDQCGEVYGTTPEAFQSQFQNEPEPPDATLRFVAEFYHVRCEQHDREVCSGPIINGEIQPATAEERFKVNAHAREVFNELVDKFHVDASKLRFEIRGLRYRKQRQSS